MSKKKYLSVVDESSEQDDLTAEINEVNTDDWDPKITAEQQNAWEARMEQMNKVSSIMGQLLLQGWTMEKEICTKCNSPLFSKKSGPMKCPQCEIMSEDSKSNENTNNSKNIESKMDKNDNNTFNDDDYWGFTQTKNEKFKKKQKQMDNASNIVGKLLLQGWTMLATHCDKCQTPKMNFKGKDEMCPYCNQQNKNESKNIVKKIIGNGINLKKTINEKMKEIRNNEILDNDNIWDNYAKQNNKKIVKLSNNNDNNNNENDLNEEKYEKPKVPKFIQDKMKNEMQYNYNNIRQSNMNYMQPMNMGIPSMQQPYYYNNNGIMNNSKNVRFNDYSTHLWLESSMENTVKQLLSKIDKINETGKNLNDLKYYLECLTKCVNIKNNCQ